MPGVVAVAVCAAAALAGAGQGVTPAKVRAEDAAAFRDFSARVLAYQALQRTVESTLPG